MRELAQLALRNINPKEKRTWLTILGIFIGIAAVVSLISLGQGLQGAIDEQFEALGTDKIIIQSNANTFGTGAGQLQNPLTTRDVEAIRSVSGVAQATYMPYRAAEVIVNDQNYFFFAAGADMDNYDLIREFFFVDLQAGRELRANDRYQAIIGADYARRAVFEQPLRIGDRIHVQGQRFNVVGILEALGNPQDDRTILVPLRAMEEIYDLGDTADMIIARIQPNADPIAIGEDIERALRQERGLREGNEDFNVQTPDEAREAFDTIFLIVQVVLIGIAAISLLVGGINITNAMFTSVLERTKEIGIMKAIGATNQQIQNVFLIESGALGLIGGAIGVAVGLAIAKGVELIGQAALNTPYLSAYVSWWLVLGSLGFAVLVGMISGWLPARQASKQNPVDSLRYE